MGKKYLVVSDNHGNMSNLEYVIERFRGKIEALIHCGDMEIPPEMLEELAGCPVYMAEGNCDYNFSRDKEDIFELGDHVAFVTHGDVYGVSWGEEELVSRAQEMGADVAKIAVMPQSREDVMTLMEATMEADHSLDIPVVTMSMGRLGVLSRLAGTLTGSAMTFASVGEASAPGQIPIEQMRVFCQLLSMK